MSIDNLLIEPSSDNLDYFSYYDNYELVLDFILGCENLNQNFYSLKTEKEIIFSGFGLDKPIFLEDKDKNVCRFCKNEISNINRDKPHVIPHSIGNKYLFSFYECKSCNGKFSDYETNFAAHLGNLTRQISRVRGKGGYPKSKASDKKSFIISDGKLVTVKQEVGSERLCKVEDNKKINLKAVKDTYIPLKVYKCLTKIALTLIPEYELPNFLETMKWINGETTAYRDDFLFLGKGYRIDYHFPLRAILLRRKNEEGLFYMNFVLTFSNFFLQIRIPYCSLDINNFENSVPLKVSAYPVFNIAPYVKHKKSNLLFSNQIQIFPHQFYDFSSSEKIKGEKEDFELENKGESYSIRIEGDEYDLYESLTEEEKIKYEQNLIEIQKMKKDQ